MVEFDAPWRPTVYSNPNSSLPSGIDILSKDKEIGRRRPDVRIRVIRSLFSPVEENEIQAFSIE